jgi:DNA polymerase-3 subunit alpha
VKGTGESAIGAIVRAREEAGPFKDVFDLCRRVDKRVVNRRVIEALVRAGALDSLHGGSAGRGDKGANRASILASVGIAMEAADQAERHANQVSLFGDAEGNDEHQLALIERPRWTDTERLSEEKLALGYYFSGHPFSGYAPEVRRFLRTELRQAIASDGEKVVAGVVMAVRRGFGNKGMLVQLSDGTESEPLEITVYPEVFDQYRALLKEDALVFLDIKVRSFRPKSEGNDGALITRVSADRAYDLTTARNRFARGVRICMNGDASRSPAAAAAQLGKLLSPYRNGACPVDIFYNNGEARVEMRLGDAWRIRLDDALMSSLKDWLKPENVEVLYG